MQAVNGEIWGARTRPRVLVLAPSPKHALRDSMEQRKFARATPLSKNCRFVIPNRDTRMKTTLYLEVISSWCFWALPAWSELQKRYADRIAFDWKIALMDPTGLPVTREQ